MRRSLCAVLALLSCACAGLKTGPAKGGEVVEVAVPAPAGSKDKDLLAAARRAAVEAVLPAFLAPGAPAGPEGALEREILGKAGSFAGKAELFGRKGGAATARVLVKVDAVGGALERLGLVRPPGYEGPPRAALVLREPDTGLGAGRAAESLRLALAAREIAALDARDVLSGRDKLLKTDTREQALAAARELGAGLLVFGSARVWSADGRGEVSAVRARVEAEVVDVASGTAAASLVREASAVDLTPGAAAGKALDDVGAAAAADLAAFLRRRESGRAELKIAILGVKDLAEARALIAAVRGVEGVSGAALGAYDGPRRAAVLRVFVRALRVDELAARLRRLPGFELQAVELEPDAGRAAFEIPGRWSGGED